MGTEEELSVALAEDLRTNDRKRADMDADDGVDVSEQLKIRPSFPNVAGSLHLQPTMELAALCHPRLKRRAQAERVEGAADDDVWKHACSGVHLEDPEAYSARLQCSAWGPGRVCLGVAPNSY